MSGRARWPRPAGADQSALLEPPEVLEVLEVLDGAGAAGVEDDSEAPPEELDEPGELEELDDPRLSFL